MVSNQREWLTWPVPSSVTRTPDSSGNPAPVIYRKGLLTLAYATCVDLDAPLSDRQWGEVALGANSGGGGDLCSVLPDFEGTNGADIVTVNSETTPPARMQRDGSDRATARTSISAWAVTYACTPTKVGIRCCALKLLIPLIPQ
jgi:hypothetical protein